MLLEIMTRSLFYLHLSTRQERELNEFSNFSFVLISENLVFRIFKIRNYKNTINNNIFIMVNVDFFIYVFFCNDHEFKKPVQR